jgi:hypothetical protein
MNCELVGLRTTLCIIYDDVYVVSAEILYVCYNSVIYYI